MTVQLDDVAERASTQARLRVATIKPQPRVQTRKRRRRWPRILKLTRRVHMYIGIALLPWVVMYGVTALLFNHSTWLSASERLELGASDVLASEFANVPTPFAMRSEVHASLSLDDTLEGDSLGAVQGSPRWFGSWVLTGSTETETVRLIVDPELRGGSIRVSPKSDDEDNAPYWTTIDTLQNWNEELCPSDDALEASGLAILSDAGFELEILRLRRRPRVLWFQESDGATYACDVTQAGKFDAERSTLDESTVRTGLLRLHLQHGDPGYSGVRRVWALLVDAMGIAMILWGISGIVMWWSIRPTRGLGFVALAGGAGIMVVAAVCVWQAAGLIA